MLTSVPKLNTQQDAAYVVDAVAEEDVDVLVPLLLLELLVLVDDAEVDDDAVELRELVFVAVDDAEEDDDDAVDEGDTDEDDADVEVLEETTELEVDEAT